MNKMTITQRSKKFKFERNKDIATKFFSRNKKYTARSLANEYQISETRVYQILRDWKKHRYFTGINIGRKMKTFGLSLRRSTGLVDLLNMKSHYEAPDFEREVEAKNKKEAIKKFLKILNQSNPDPWTEDMIKDVICEMGIYEEQKRQ